MDVLKKSLLIAFYVGIIAVGIIGFIALKSVREQPPQPELPAKEVQNPVADSLVSEDMIE